jgi:SpoVK/Ycf46/Vps4 family AAA+-type ATPase
MDEIDLLLSHGDGSSNATNGKVIGTLLSDWDGMQSNEGVIVVAATNNAKNIDLAVLRRLPRQLSCLCFCCYFFLSFVF